MPSAVSSTKRSRCVFTDYELCQQWPQLLHLLAPFLALLDLMRSRRLLSTANKAMIEGREKWEKLKITCKDSTVCSYGQRCSCLYSWQFQDMES
jgi:hypothetical protein